MRRRTFFGVLLAGIASLLTAATKHEYRPKAGHWVRIISYPDHTSLGPDPQGVVLGECENPTVMNQHYIPHLQLWKVNCGPMDIQCYAHELQFLRERKGQS